MAPAAVPVAIGTRLPDCTFSYIYAGFRRSITLSELTRGKMVSLFTNSKVREDLDCCADVGGFAPPLSAVGAAPVIDTVACITQEDPLSFQGRQEDQMMILSDENGAFTKALGMDPATARYCLHVKDNIVEYSKNIFG